MGSDDKIKTKNSLVSIKLFIFPSQGFSVHPLANKDAGYYNGSLAVCYSINNWNIDNKFEENKKV